MNTTRRITRTTTTTRANDTQTRHDDMYARACIVRCEQCDALIVDDVTCMNCAHVRDASRIRELLIDNDARRVHTFNVNNNDA
jgi:hypothetical protein